MLRNFPRLDESKVLAPADDPVGIVDGQQVNLGIRPEHIARDRGEAGPADHADLILAPCGVCRLVVTG